MSEKLKKNIKTTGLDQSAEVRNTDVFSYLRNVQKSFDIIFLDPPYFKGLWSEVLYKLAEMPQLLNSEGIIMCRVHPKEYVWLDKLFDSFLLFQ